MATGSSDPSNPTRAAGGEYLRFLVWAVGLAVVLAGIGYVPTRSLAGERGVAAMLAGCAVGLFASLLGGVPVYLARAGAAGNPGGAAGTGSSGGRVETAALGGMAVRFAVALGLGLAAVLTGWFARGPLLVWAAVSYVVLLVIDTRYALGRL